MDEILSELGSSSRTIVHSCIINQEDDDEEQELGFWDGTVDLLCIPHAIAVAATATEQQQQQQQDPNYCYFHVPQHLQNLLVKHPHHHPQTHLNHDGLLRVPRMPYPTTSISSHFSTHNCPTSLFYHNHTPPSSPNPKILLLHRVKLTTEDLINHNLACAVCKDDFIVGQKVRKLPCSHHYHGHCIRPWLKHHSTCPVCRYQL